jgi:hypothetical protein
LQRMQKERRLRRQWLDKFQPAVLEWIMASRESGDDERNES